MNIKKIQPIQIWTANGQKEINLLSLTNFYNYHFDDGAGLVTYKLIYGDDNGAIEYIVAEIEIPSNIIQQWGASDDVIWNYIATTLNLQLL